VPALPLTVHQPVHKHPARRDRLVIQHDFVHSAAVVLPLQFRGHRVPHHRESRSLTSGISSGIGYPVTNARKIRENRLRRALYRQGYRLMKSRARDPRDLTYGGYQIVDPTTGGIAAGWGNANHGYGLDLDDAESWAKGD
jgi:hypothetical protein